MSIFSKVIVRISTVVAAAVFFAAAGALPAGAVPRTGDAAPAFELPTAHGGKTSLGDFRGKPLYVNFFASWCAPCNAEAGSVGVLYTKYHARGLAIVGVNELEDSSKALDFAHRYRWPFTVALDGNGEMVKSYGVIGLPVHVFIDRSGKVSTFRLGEMNPGEIEDAIKKII